jgi:hypothetical protein
MSKLIEVIGGNIVDDKLMKQSDVCILDMDKDKNTISTLKA